MSGTVFSFDAKQEQEVVGNIADTVANLSLDRRSASVLVSATSVCDYIRHRDEKALMPCTITFASLFVRVHAYVCRCVKACCTVWCGCVKSGMQGRRKKAAAAITAAAAAAAAVE